MELIGSVVVFIGAVFLFSAGLGMLRMPDAFTRIQAGTKASTLGNTLILLGVAFYHPDWSLKLLIIAYFVLMTHPISSHALARAANAVLGPAVQSPVAHPSGADLRKRSGNVVRRVAAILLVVLLGIIFATIAANYSERTSLPELAAAYVDLVPRELGAPNIITGILLTYRAFDTLGEVAVLFMVAAGLGLLLGGDSKGLDRAPAWESVKATPSTEIVKNGAEILVPLIAIFAVYIVMHGHLGPGGGFQGGAVMACCVLLLLLAKSNYRIKLAHLSIIESLAGLLIVLVGIAGIILAGGFLDSRVLPLGEFGAFFSAGAIPVLSILLGVKVGCELSVIIERFRA
ncbi:MAG: monovalent cation/H(+) antiporter subunit G [Methyloceanibacter sp.]|nr:monovalent cation/H(+) antiporter subunit G [Methyloceanibacter sp.]